MAANLLDTIRRALPANFTELASKLVGESPGATQTAVTAALPVLVAAVAHKGAATQGAETLLPLLDDPAVQENVLSNLPGLGSGQDSAALTSRGSGLLASLLGDKSGALAGTLTSISGLRNTQSASALLALLAPIVCGFIRKLGRENGLGPSGLASLLAAQAPFLQGTLDRRLTSALGFASPSSLLDSLGGEAAAATGSAGAAIGSTGAAVGAGGAVASGAAQRAGVAADTAAPRAGAAAASGAQRTAISAATATTDATRPRASWTRWLPWLIGAMIVLFVLSRLSTCSETADTSAPPAKVPPATAPAPAATAPAATTPPATTPPAAPPR